jgi:tetratricopeptide (TPR) repeat protein
MNPTTQRGILLLQQGRHDLAIQEFQQCLVSDPQDGFAHACIALCLGKQKKYVEASESAARAIESDPDQPFPHYAAASVFHDRNRLPEAARAIAEAIRLNPYDATFHGLSAAIQFNQKNWQGALQQATKGLEIDPDDAMCTNIRAMAMVRLGQAPDARTELESSLRRDPENATTHASLGWAALERGDRAQALESFRESLRIDPNLDWARQGMLHALKLGYPLYGLFLKYMLWMQKLSGRAQWLVLILGYFGFRSARELAVKQPALAPWIMPFVIAYIIFAYLTWVRRPLTNLFLRFNRFGRAILNDDERRESNLIGATLLIGLAAGATYLATADVLALIAMAICAILVIPFSSIYGCQAGWPRRISAMYAAGMAILGLVLLASPFIQVPVEVFGNLFMAGTILSPWISNFLIMSRVRH